MRLKKLGSLKASTILRTLTILTATLAPAAAIVFAGPATAADAPTDCESVNGYSFVCGVPKPEDMKVIPGTHWLVTSGLALGAGLKLIDTDAKTARMWWTGAPGEIKPDLARYSMCPGPPNPAQFGTNGLSLHARGSRQQTLYAVNRGGREAIEVFEIHSGKAAPTAVWIGCVPLPEGLAGNSVAAFDDGTILTTVQFRPGRTSVHQALGSPTGAVYQWQPGDTGFSIVPGTELSGNNGIETSPDGKQFYVNGTGDGAVFVYDRNSPGKGPVRKATTPNFMPDNLSWTTPPGGGKRVLVVAGMVADEPACGGPRKVVDGRIVGATCPRGYVVAALDPKTMAWTIIDHGEPNPVFTGVATAAFVGDNVWLSSYMTDRLAWRSLPSKRTAGN